MKEHDNFKYTCLFGGGAIRGVAHVGAIKALEHLGIQISTLGGSSVGSLIAALYAVGYSSEELNDIFNSINFEIFKDLSIGFNQKFALSKGDVFLERVKELIERKYYKDEYIKGQCKPVTFKDIQKDLIIITTNLKDFTCQEFSKFETPDFEIALAVRISCCMPGLMRAININDKLLVDGDLMKGKPMWSLSKHLQNSPNRILEIRLEGTFNGSDQSPIEYVNGMYTCITSSETSFIKSLYGNCDRYDYLVINTGDVVVVDFNYPIEKRQAITNDGYRQTLSYFKNLLIEKKKNLLEIYTIILDKLRQMQGLFLCKKYQALKNSTAELFIYLSQVKDCIDEDIYNEILDFQKLAFSHIKTGLLGRSICKDREELRETLSKSISDTTISIKEMEKYISKFSI
jgi:NTE family protein